MAQLQGTIIASMVVPTDSLDAYATHSDKYGRGGYRSVADLVERDAITEPRRKEGMKVFVNSVSTEYQLTGGITNANWVVSGTSAPSSSISFQCDEDIGAYKVCVVVSNQLYLADSSNLAHLPLTKYMSKDSKLSGEVCEVIEEGQLSQVGWGLSPNVSYFLGSAGELVSTPPLGGFIQKIGVAETTDRIYLDPKIPIKI